MASCRISTRLPSMACHLVPKTPSTCERGTSFAKEAWFMSFSKSFQRIPSRWCATTARGAGLPVWGNCWDTGVERDWWQDCIPLQNIPLRQTDFILRINRCIWRLLLSPDCSISIILLQHICCIDAWIIHQLPVVAIFPCYLPFLPDALGKTI